MSSSTRKSSAWSSKYPNEVKKFDDQVEGRRTAEAPHIFEHKFD